ncbi:MAG: FkbM family methyltransferase [Cyclobacteriaceae bacterium]
MGFELAKKYAKAGTIVLDIGANVGGFTLRLATHCLETDKQVHIHAFEPNHQIFESLEKNLSLNLEINSLVNIHRYGIGNTSEVKSFEVAESNSGAGRVVSLSKEINQVQIQRLDDFASQLDASPISFIKLIIEGSEPEALKGGWNIIVKHKPPIFLEVTPSWWAENGNRVGEVLERLGSLGYQFKIEQKNELVEYYPEKHATLFQYNLLAYQ